MFAWSYYTFRDGKLYDEDDNLAFDKTFADEKDAEQYLIDNDMRVTVK